MIDTLTAVVEQGECRMLKQRLRAGVSIAIVLAAIRASTVPAVARPTAQAARNVTVRDTIRLTLVRKSGAVLYERGTATGMLPGRVNAKFNTSVTKVTGHVAIYPTSGGWITINVVGYPQSLGAIARFHGTMAVREGAGRFADAYGGGDFTGTVNRRTWAVTVNANARVTY
jgi:hypothetical protein